MNVGQKCYNFSHVCIRKFKNKDMSTQDILQVTAVFVRNDKDGDGKLSKEEFKEMMCREKKIQDN